MSIFSKSIFIVFLFSLSSSFGQIRLKEKKQINHTTVSNKELRTIPKDQLKAIKENYNWTKAQYLIVNFKNLQTKCSYDIYNDLVVAFNLYEKKAYEKMDLTNCRNIFLYADKDLAEPILDYKTHFEDIGLYFMKNYFNQNNTCVGVMVINQNGEYLVKTEEYNTFTIEEMIQKL